jgi:sporulation protein YlmC with PRC-barrel domain
MAPAAGTDSQDANATPEAQEGQQAAAGGMQRVALADFEGLDVINERGEQLGDVNSIVQSTADQKQYVVINHGGFLGLGEKTVALSLEGLMMQGDRLVVPGLTDDEIRALPEFTASDQYPEVQDAEVQVRTMAAQ